MTANLADIVADIAARRPDAAAIITDRRVTPYVELTRAVTLTAAALTARGVRPGVPVGQVIGDAPADFVLLLALFRLGAPALILAAGEPPELHGELLTRVGASECVAAETPDGDCLPAFARALAASGMAPSLPPPPDDDATAYYNRSSGTTRGRAKLIAISHAQRCARDSAIGSALGRHPGDRHLHVVTLANSLGRGAATATIQAEGAVVFPPPIASVGDVRSLVDRLGVTTTALSPPHVRDLLRSTHETPAMPGVRLVVGSAAMTRAERRLVLERVTPQLYVAYGTNETGSIAVAAPADLAVDIDSVGRAFPGIEAAVVDAALRPLPSGTPGELRFRNPAFPRDYLASVPGSTSRFRDGWFYPGDAGKIDDEGRITLLGRIDDVINVGGRKIHPSAIEEWLAAHAAVTDAAAIAARAGRMGEVPVVAVVLRTPTDEADLMAFCRARAGGLPLPARIVAVGSIPRNAGGKVDRMALAALLAPALDR
ncbi:MAG: class I adenylate-forming enzyme family protein [Alphaproteobacteria bacterium]